MPKTLVIQPVTRIEGHAKVTIQLNDAGNVDSARVNVIELRGFEKFCNGETDINDASRPIKDEEAHACASNGIEYTAFLVALDGLTVVVNPGNDWAQCLPLEQLVQLFGNNSTAQTWADIDPAWPAERPPRS